MNLKCPWCQKKPVPIKNGRLASHVTAGNQKCLGIGQPANKVKALNQLRDGRETRMIPIAEAAKARGISERRLRALCKQRRIAGAKLIGRLWHLPENWSVTPGRRGPPSTI